MMPFARLATARGGVTQTGDDDGPALDPTTMTDGDRQMAQQDAQVERVEQRRVGQRAMVLAPIVVAVALVLVIQLVPYGRAHANPPVTGEPAWATPRTRELMVRACFDCHSNEVEWPWYSRIAPISWIVTDHVDEGRAAVNYSQWDTGGGDEAHETIETIAEGEMPPGYYTLFGLHGDAKLTEAERAELIAGLQATPGMGEGGEGRRRERGGTDDDD
jgi:hypothetical protein